jgi:DNA processing protein
MARPGRHAMSASGACDACLSRSWLLDRLGGHLERARARIEQLLALSPPELIAALAGSEREKVAEELADLDPGSLRRAAAAAGLDLVCRCHSEYPARLHHLEAPPSVLYVAGDLRRLLELLERDPVAIVGARRASPYGLEVARSLGRGLAGSGVTVLSGMALGVDAAAHAGALDVGCPTVAVLPSPAERPYPASKRALYRQIIKRGAAVSELAPRAAVWRWTFPARNRIIAALSATAVVVEAGARSGALLTARFGRGLGRPVGAVPGRITAPHAVGPNGLIAEGAYVVRGPQDVLDQLFGAGVRAARRDERPRLEPELQRLLAAIGQGCDTPAALARAGFSAEQGLAALSALELAGYVCRGAGGKYVVVP